MRLNGDSIANQNQSQQTVGGGINVGTRKVVPYSAVVCVLSVEFQQTTIQGAEKGVGLGERLGSVPRQPCLGSNGKGVVTQSAAVGHTTYLAVRGNSTSVLDHSLFSTRIGASHLVELSPCVRT